jgi:hypothetical protein
MIRAHEVAVDEMWVPVWPSCERLVRTRATKQGEGGPPGLASRACRVLAARRPQRSKRNS